MYDYDRNFFLEIAAHFASRAREVEIDSGQRFDRGTDTSAAAVRLWQLTLAYDSADSTGDIRYYLARSLLLNGQANEAPAVARQIVLLLKTSLDFCYEFACILSAIGDFRESLQWLEGAITWGMLDIATINRDPRLARLRAAAPGQVKMLTEVKATWSITWGTFNDDIVLKNESQFPLTNVELQYELKQDARPWNGKLMAVHIAPGQSHVWRNEISVPGRRLTSKTATLGCDQGVRVVAPRWNGSHR